MILVCQASSGYIRIDINGNSTLRFVPTEDYKTEGTETFTLSLIGSSVGGDQWQNISIEITILDTSVPPTYALEASSLSVHEGSEVTITLKTTNVPIGTEVGYALTNLEDLGLSSPLGTFVIGDNGMANVSFAPIEDFKLEGTETFMLVLASSSFGETEWKDVSIEITILDTSVPLPTPTPTPTETPTLTPTPTETPTHTPTPTPTETKTEKRNSDSNGNTDTDTY